MRLQVDRYMNLDLRGKSKLDIDIDKDIEINIEIDIELETTGLESISYAWRVKREEKTHMNTLRKFSV